MYTTMSFLEEQRIKMFKYFEHKLLCAFYVFLTKTNTSINIHYKAFMATTINDINTVQTYWLQKSTPEKYFQSTSILQTIQSPIYTYINNWLG